MFAKPQAEHEWLSKFVGNWTAETECVMGPDQPPSRSTSQIAVRSLSGMWIVAEFTGDMPDMGPWTSLMTLGYDPIRGQYVGTFIGSMMNHLWLYAGNRQDGGNRLVLDTEGPKFDGSVGLAKYQDIVEWHNDDLWTLSSRVQQADGTWHDFMHAEHKRQK
jgi:hypothetical protein